MGDTKIPGNTVEGCHCHVGQSEVEQKVVGCCPHSLHIYFYSLYILDQERLKSIAIINVSHIFWRNQMHYIDVLDKKKPSDKIVLK